MSRSSKRKGTRKRKCFVCGCFVWMNASMHRHVCLYRVNAHVLVESVPGAKQIDGEDKQTDRIVSFPITPRPAYVSQLLSLSCSHCQWWKTGSCLNRRLPCNGRTDRQAGRLTERRIEPDPIFKQNRGKKTEVWLKVRNVSQTARLEVLIGVRRRLLKVKIFKFCKKFVIKSSQFQVGCCLDTYIIKLSTFLYLGQKKKWWMFVTKSQLISDVSLLQIYWY